MHCIDGEGVRAGLGLAALGLVAMLTACSSRPTAPSPSTAAVPAAVGRPAPARPAPSRPEPAEAAPAAARNWDDYRLHAAQRIVAANPGTTYMSRPPEPLLAIPVLEIELNGDGSVRRIEVLRQPSQARDTVQLAIDAVRRAAPFGDVTRLPRPWKFSEVFLFGDDRRFKPRTLDR